MKGMKLPLLPNWMYRPKKRSFSWERKWKVKERKQPIQEKIHLRKIIRFNSNIKIKLSTMRRLFFLTFLMASVTVLQAQKLDDVQKDISNNKYSDAKIKIDKMLTDPKNAAD